MSQENRVSRDERQEREDEDVVDVDTEDIGRHTLHLIILKIEVQTSSYEDVMIRIRGSHYYCPSDIERTCIEIEELTVRERIGGAGPMLDVFDHYYGLTAWAQARRAHAHHIDHFYWAYRPE